MAFMSASSVSANYKELIRGLKVSVVIVSLFNRTWSSSYFATSFLSAISWPVVFILTVLICLLVLCSAARGFSPGTPVDLIWELERFRIVTRCIWKFYAFGNLLYLSLHGINKYFIVIINDTNIETTLVSQQKICLLICELICKFCFYIDHLKLLYFFNISEFTKNIWTKSSKNTLICLFFLSFALLHTQWQTWLTTEFQEFFRDLQPATLLLPCCNWLLILGWTLSW